MIGSLLCALILLSSVSGLQIPLRLRGTMRTTTIKPVGGSQTAVLSSLRYRKGASPLTIAYATLEEQPEVDILPRHEKMIEGKLENGFSYVILPNSVPEGRSKHSVIKFDSLYCNSSLLPIHHPMVGRFEAHLEVLSGSANELKEQQGMAHLLEHVAYSKFNSLATAFVTLTLIKRCFPP